MIQLRKDELVRSIEKITQEINQKGDHFNDAEQYYIRSNQPDDDNMDMADAKDGEALEWLQRLGVEGNPSVMKTYTKNVTKRIWGVDMQKLQEGAK